MKKFRKLAASIAAITTALSLSVGTLAVTANEAKKAVDADSKYTLAEKQVIATYEKKGVSDVARYLLDNDFTVSDTQKILELYIDGKNKRAQNTTKEKLQNPERSSTTPFYSTTNKSKNPHFGVVIADNGITNTGMDYLGIGYTNVVSLSASLSVNNYTYFTNFSASGYTDKVLHGMVSGTTTTGVPIAVCDFPFSVVSNTTNEYAIYDQFSFNPHADEQSYTGTSYIYHTYVQGDFNHDGLVDTIDLSFIIDYNMSGGTTPIPDSYESFNSNIARVINTLAADADRNGDIGPTDISWYTTPGRLD